MADRVMPVAEVATVTGLCRSTILKRVKAGEFPRPLRMSPRRIGWLESEVQALLVARGAERVAA